MEPYESRFPGSYHKAPGIYLVGSTGTTVKGVIGPYAQEEVPLGTLNGRRTLKAQGAEDIWQGWAASAYAAGEKVRKELRGQ